MKDFFPPSRSRPPGGYMGKILRVDLTSGSIKDENLPEESWLRKLIGGQALASYLTNKACRYSRYRPARERNGCPIGLWG